MPEKLQIVVEQRQHPEASRIEMIAEIDTSLPPLERRYRVFPLADGGPQKELLRFVRPQGFHHRPQLEDRLARSRDEMQ
jgi:hypothetical protein